MAAAGDVAKVVLVDPYYKGKALTTLTMRMIRGHFVVSGPDVEPMKFKSRPEARDWCKAHHPGSPITEIGPSGKRAKKPPERRSRKP
jgi:hypothetical protein